MARLPRLTVTGYPHHLILRGNNRQAIFVSQADRLRMLDLLAHHSAENSVQVHAYVLMDNHLHLLVTPQIDGGLPAMMQGVGRSYVRAFNDAQGRTGTLWEGRYRSSVIQSDRYLLACMVYIDLNPVRAGMVAQAVRVSSAAAATAILVKWIIGVPLQRSPSRNARPIPHCNHQRPLRQGPMAQLTFSTWLYSSSTGVARPKIETVTLRR